MMRLILFFMACLMAFGGTSWAEDVLPCPGGVDMLPIKFGVGDITTLSDSKMPFSDQIYSDFVMAVTVHLADKLAQNNLCLNSAESKERSVIKFWHDGFSSGIKPPPPLKTRPVGICRITSPWLDLSIQREPVPSVQAIFRYSERQLVADQAILAGVRNVPSGVVRPLSREEFIKFGDVEYANSEIRQIPPKKPIEERVPPDILWLFRQSHQALYAGYLFHVQAYAAINTAIKISTESYTKIVISLIDRCFESEGDIIHYNNILDIKDAALLEQYKITTSIATDFADGVVIN